MIWQMGGKLCQGSFLVAKIIFKEFVLSRLY